MRPALHLAMLAVPLSLGASCSLLFDRDQSSNMPADAAVSTDSDVSDAGNADTSLCRSLAPLRDDFAMQHPKWVASGTLSEISFGPDGLVFTPTPLTMGQTSHGLIRSTFTHDARGRSLTVEFSDTTTLPFYVALQSTDFSGVKSRAQISNVSGDYNFDISHDGVTQTIVSTKTFNEAHKVWRIRHEVVPATPQGKLYFTTGATLDTLDLEESTIALGQFRPEAAQVLLGYTWSPSTTITTLKGINLAQSGSPYCLAESLKLPTDSGLSADWVWTSVDEGNAELTDAGLVLAPTPRPVKLVNLRGLVLQGSSLIVRFTTESYADPISFGLERNGQSSMGMATTPTGQVIVSIDFDGSLSTTTATYDSPTGFKFESSGAANPVLRLSVFQDDRWHLVEEKENLPLHEPLSLFIRHKAGLVITTINVEP